jgi:hypothetical protein
VTDDQRAGDAPTRNPSTLATATDTPGTPAAPSTTFAPPASPTSWAPPTPVAPSAVSASSSPKNRGLVAGLVAAGVVMLGLAAGIGVWVGAQAATHSPAAAVKPYLTALEKGDVAAAVKAGHISTHSPLVAASVYTQARDQVSTYRVSGVAVHGSSAVVDVDYVQSGQHRTQSLSLRAEGRDDLFFTRWVLQPVRLDTLDVAVAGPANATLTVNDQPVPATAGSYQVLPGSYDVTVTATDDYSADTQTVTASDLDAADGGGAQKVTLQPTLTDAGRQAAVAAVDAWVAGCVASTELVPSGCSFGAINDIPQYTQTNTKWTLDSAPQFTVGDWTEGGWAVTTTTAGSATFSADISDSAGDTGTASTNPIPVQVAGVITGFVNGKAVFQSINWSGSQAIANA